MLDDDRVPAPLNGRTWSSGRGRILMVAACLAASPACGSREVEAPIVRQLGDDTFMSGGQLRLERETRGDAVLAGGTITVAAPVSGDGVFAGGELELTGPFGEDVYAAGGEIRVAGDIAGNGRFAGGTVSFGPESSVRGGLSVAAGRAEILGAVEDYVQVTAGTTQLGGRVAGDVEVNGGELRVGPSAIIEGDLVFRGPQAPEVAPGAVVRGEVRHVPAEATGTGEGWLGFGLFALVACLGMALAAALLWSLWPGSTRAIERVLRSRPGTALLAGLGVVFLTPPVMGLLFLSVIGIPLALLALPLYLLAFPLGFLAACVGIADWVLERARATAESGWLKRLLALTLVLLVVSLFGLIPLIGWAGLFVLTLIGIGALVLASIDARRGGAAKATAPTPTPGGWKPLPDDKAPASA